MGKTGIATSSRNKLVGKGKVYCPKVNLIRYADDFVVTAESRELLDEIKILLTDFLAQRGLTLSEEKTPINIKSRLYRELSNFVDI
jgi:RNA-directed DNA polymerase